MKTSFVFFVLALIPYMGIAQSTQKISSSVHNNVDSTLIQNYVLNEVVIKATQSMFNMRNDRITLNVAGTALSESGSAMDVLQKAARVKIDENGVSVLGAGNALIMVDGRELPSNQALEMISSSEIQKIDILINPSSKYDAKGKAVIEIYTKKAKNQGFGAEVTGRVSKGEYWNPYVGAELSAKASGLSLYGFYAFSPTKKYITESYLRDYTKEIAPSYGLINMESINKTAGNHRICFSGDYSFSGKHKAGLQLSAQFLNGNNLRNEISRIYNSNDTQVMPETELSSVQHIPFNRSFSTGTAYYSYQSSPAGITINSVFDKSRYSTDQSSHIKESGNLGLISKQNDSRTKIDITSFKVDVLIPLPNNYKMETGLKYSNIHNQSNTFFSSEGVASRNIDYKYRENIGALYLILSKQFEKLNAEIGARVEVSDIDATTDVVVQDAIRQNIFPNLNLNYCLDKDWNIVFSYSMKISRPAFQDMNPAIEYVDSLVYFQGNPKLVPEIRQVFNLKLSYMKMMSFGVNYTRKNNPLAWYAEQDSDNPVLMRLTQKNINKSDILSIDILLPYQNNWLSCYLSTGLIYTTTNDKVSGVIDFKQPMGYAYSDFDFSFPRGFKLNANFRYFSKGLENVFYFDPVFRMDVSIRKSLLKEQLTASILWNDIFRTDYLNTYTTINNRYIGYRYYYDLSVVSFSLTYRFNSLKSKYQSRSSINEENQRIKKDAH